MAACLVSTPRCLSVTCHYILRASTLHFSTRSWPEKDMGTDSIAIVAACRDVGTYTAITSTLQRQSRFNRREFLCYGRRIPPGSIRHGAQDVRLSQGQSSRK